MNNTATPRSATAATSRAACTRSSRWLLLAETGQAVPAGLPGQGLLGLDPRAQVMLVTQVVRHLAGLVFDRRKVQLVPPDSTVFAVVEDDALVLLTAADRLGQGTNSLWVGPLCLKKSAVATDHLGTGVAGQLLEDRVDVEHRVVVGLMSTTTTPLTRPWKARTSSLGMPSGPELASCNCPGTCTATGPSGRLGSTGPSCGSRVVRPTAVTAAPRRCGCPNSQPCPRSTPRSVAAAG